MVATLEKGRGDKRLEASRLIKEGTVIAQRRENESLNSGRGDVKATHSRGYDCQDMEIRECRPTPVQAGEDGTASYSIRD